MKPILALAAMLAAMPAMAGADSPPAGPAPAPGLLGAAINVVDLAREVDFYTRGLGWKVATTLPLGNRTETILVPEGNSSGASILLMHDNAPTAPARLEHGNAFSRLVIRSASLQAVAARLDSLGYAHGEIRGSSAAGYRIMMLTDPEGFRIELVEQVAKGNP